MKTSIITMLFGIASMLFSVVMSSSMAIAEESEETNIKKAEIKTSAVCEDCKQRIEKAVNELDGIKSVDLNYETKILTVEYDLEEIELETIKKQVAYTGYDADDIKADRKAYKKLPDCCQIHRGMHK